MNEVERYIRERAAYYGIDPDIAVRVAKAEGGLSNPQQQGNAHHDPASWQDAKHS